MKNLNHCTGKQYIYTAIIFVVHWSFSNIDLENEKTHSRIRNAEEKGSMTTVPSKVTSEPGRLDNSQRHFKQ